MYVQQLYTKCLSEAAYYIESNGESIIIDPLRDPDPYLRMADERGTKIKYILETHFHADFVSGHLDLSRASGAPVVLYHKAKAAYPFFGVKDGDVLSFGGCEIHVLYTPGHTMESVTYLLKDEQGKNYCIFTGDTLFIGDVGRPDLAAGLESSTEEMAGLLYDSLRKKIIPLADDVIVYPAHGAGSACGKSMSKETFATLGHQKANNYALQANLTRDQFVEELTTDLAAPPKYFPQNVAMNKLGYKQFEELIKNAEIRLTPEEFQAKMEEKRAIVLDTRSAKDFTRAHIPGSLFIGIDGGFAPWVGSLIEDVATPILVVADKGREEEVVMRLSRVGYDYVEGILDGGIIAWVSAGYDITSIDNTAAVDLAKINQADRIVDVRKKGEYDSSHLSSSIHIPLVEVGETAGSFSPEGRHYIHCAGGYRSVIACSILKQNGVDNVVNVLGGYDEIQKTNLPRTETACANS
jgi:hydroxyacylglutathione hydrolase